MQRLHVDRPLRSLGRAGEGPGGVRDALAAPFGDLVGVDIEALRELGERRGAFDCARASCVPVGPPPVTPIGGASGLAPGRHMFITADFQPGHYALLCFIPDARDRKPHSDHGMMKEIVVAR